MFAGKIVRTIGKIARETEIHTSSPKDDRIKTERIVFRRASNDVGEGEWKNWGSMLKCRHTRNERWARTMYSTWLFTDGQYRV